MFIVWGRNVSRKRVGYVADFCPMCRGAQAFLMKSVSSYRHVYYVPTGDRTSGYERTCQGCNITFSGTPKYYKASKTKPNAVQDLVRSSFPSFDEVYADRLRIEAAVRKDPSALPPNIRTALIRQPFSVVTPLVQSRFAAQSRLDGFSIMALVLALVGVIVALKIAEMMHSEQEGTVLVVVGLLGVLYFLWALMSEPRRYLKKFIVPRLAKTLEPLRPSESEVTQVLAELKKSKQRLGRHVRAEHLMKRMAV
jgi:hypothetical protein